MGKFTQAELEDSIKYLDSLNLEKGQTAMDFSEQTNGGKEEQIKKLQGEFNDYINKAKEAKAKIDELEKSDEPEEVGKKKEEKGEEDDKEKDGKEKEVKEEDKPNLDKEEIIKSVRESIFGEITDLIKSKDEEIQILSQRLEQISNEPVRKSIVGGQGGIIERFHKSKSEGRTPVFKTDKTSVSNHLYNLFVSTEDEIEKSKVSDAIAQFESANFLDPMVQQRVQEKYNIEIIG